MQYAEHTSIRNGLGILHSVAGIGDITLSLKRPVASSGELITTSVTLSHVLHIPTASCNVLNPILAGLKAKARNKRTGMRQWIDSSENVPFITRTFLELERIIVVPSNQRGASLLDPMLSITPPRYLEPRLKMIMSDYQCSTLKLLSEKEGQLSIPGHLVAELADNCFPEG
ncbi:uncharacterized protein LY89DRAFT_684592 [Mollisia scopiformis]|uniref:Uncharacterized protein n=1 Tax=Mollisia scopiformis TaxID=149040 RepID=A0A194XBN2_MOLSC|nr:uncharacterized protein LY89DRAFT_684592 [Mollisia scopiformis]KUJ17575.1 hypothetical protein LY89DRAFT_684592 [Mollisia scopiformis]